MSVHPSAGHAPATSQLIDVDAVIRAYYEAVPDLGHPDQAVSFGTSGHRGSPLQHSFTERHVLAMTQAICDYRKSQGITGPLFLGKDTHAVSAPSERTALEVLAANEVQTYRARDDGFTPTPVISHAILVHNRGRKDLQADGIVVTPSHNPPADGGFKYNPPHGGPADTDVTGWIQERANALLRDDLKDVKRVAYKAAIKAASTQEYDYVESYVRDLGSVLNMEAIRDARVKIGVDPLGGSAVHYWERVSEVYGLEMRVVNPRIDPSFAFMPLDHDGKIRMDCSSPYAMTGLVTLKDAFDVAFGNDPDADRHGIVTKSAGLMNPNYYLAVAIGYLLQHRPQWPTAALVGKTVVSSGLIDRAVLESGRRLSEVPVGFKWFAPGLYAGSLCFGCEESAGASFLRMNGTVWTTDKDGLLLGLLAAEITAATGTDPGEHYRELITRLGEPHYIRIDAPASPDEKKRLSRLSPEAVSAATLAGERIVAKMTQAPGNGAAIGGLKVVAEHGWFAARPSGTENIYKLYAESFKSQSHLDAIVEEAQAIVRKAL